MATATIVNVENIPVVETALNGVGINAAQAAAINSAVKGDNKQVPVGKHKVDITVRIRGEVTKSPDSMAEQPAKVNLWNLMRLLANKLNKDTIDSVINQAIAEYNAGNTVEDPELKAYVENAFAKLGKATTAPRSGQTRFKGTVDVIED